MHQHGRSVALQLPHLPWATAAAARPESYSTASFPELTTVCLTFIVSNGQN
jgi:hypothetical protein